MNSTKFEFICKNLFGRSWRAQIADYLCIDRRRVTDWIKRGQETLPDFVEPALKELIARRKIEIQYAEEIESNFDYHKYSIFTGDPFHYDFSKLNLNEIKEMINNQYWNTLQEAKSQLCNGDNLKEVLNFIDDVMLSNDDIASAAEKEGIENLDIIQELRGDACNDVKQAIEDLADRLNK